MCTYRFGTIVTIFSKVLQFFLETVNKIILKTLRICIVFKLNLMKTVIRSINNFEYNLEVNFDSIVTS